MMVELDSGWVVRIIVDDDGHLNIYITNTDCQEIFEIDTGQGSGINEQLALRFTTNEIEGDYATSSIVSKG
jgi:hypothetical protein